MEELKRKILLADDRAGVVEGMKDILSIDRSPKNIEVYYSVMKLYERVQGDKVNDVGLIIADNDFKYEKVTGSDILMDLRAKRKLTLPLRLQSGIFWQEDINYYARFNIDAYIKPISPNELRSYVLSKMGC